MSNSEYGFDDWIKEVRHASLLNDCIEYPLRPGLDKLAETDKTAKMLRDRSIAKLMGTLPQPDYTLFTWSKAIFDHFDFLIRWIENYTLGVGIVNDWDLNKAIEKVQKEILDEKVDETFARNVLSPSKSFWKENEEYYQKERERERAKAEKEKV